MNNDEKIAIKIIFNILIDKAEHQLYEFHSKHRLSPLLIRKAIKFLNEHEMITMDDDVVKIRDFISNRKIAVINRVSKVEKPEILCRSMFDM